MLPGKVYKPEDVLRLARRRLWLLLVPAAVVGAATAVVVRQMPDRYSSSVTMLVIPQRISENLVPTAVNSRFEDRLQTIANTILSRTRLERIIEEENLYQEERRAGKIMQDVVERMRNRDLQIRPNRDSFGVTYWGTSPRSVQQVASKVANLFIEENTRERSLQAESTTQFFDSELEGVERRLRQAEKDREDFRVRFSGRLPEDRSGNEQALSNVQNRLRTSADALNHARQRKLDLERRLAGLELASQTPVDPIPQPLPSGDPNTTPVGTTEQKLLQARAVLAGLEARGLSGAHPDMIRYKGIVTDLEAAMQAEALRRPVSEAVPVSREAAERQRSMAQVRDDLVVVDREIRTEEFEQKRLQGMSSDYQQRIDIVPSVESQWLEVTRAHELLKTRHGDLLGKSENAKMAANMERRQIGEQYKIIDPARIPQRPDSPNRPLLTVVGVFGGLGLGVLLAGLIEYRDTSFKTDTEITRLLAIPVLAIVPLMQSDEDRARSRRRRWLVGIGCSTMIAASLVVLAYTFVR